MNLMVRGVAALMCAAALACVAGDAFAQQRTSLATERDKVSYMVGMDVARSLEAAAPDIDMAAFERAIRNGIDGKPPLISEQEAAAISPALSQRAAARSGRQVPGLAPGSMPPEVARDKVGLMLGANIGMSLRGIADDIDLPVVLQGFRVIVDKGTPLLSEEDTKVVAAAFAQRRQAKVAEAAQASRQAGIDFLAANKTKKGVFTTASGLQYTVLTNGTGARPIPSSRVRVHYHGTLLDGTVFDSSVQRNQPAEFGLGQVIAGWTEGLTLMPVGAKYRFWIPSELGYGQNGSPPTIGPNSVLVFEVELLQIL